MTTIITSLAEISDRYDAEPPAGTDENDLKVIGGLSYKL